MTLRIRLAQAVPRGLVHEVEKAGVYCSPQVLSIRVEGDGAEVSVEHEGDGVGLEDKVRRFVTGLAARHRDVPTRVLHARQTGRPVENRERVVAEMQRQGWLMAYGPGQWGLSGLALELADAVDAHLAQLYRARFDAVSHRYPSLIPAELLARCQYLGHFPQALSVVSHLVEDFDTLENFRRANAASQGLVLPDPAMLAPPSACLNPAACFHCYPTFEHQVLPPRGARITARTRCFRYESRNMRDLERLWEFSVRELVFLDTEKAILERMAQARTVAQELLELWDLSGSLETASDAFFATVHAHKAFFQRAHEVKLELRLPLGDGSSVAVGSINLHGPFFGEAFTIRTGDGNVAHSMCMGFGLERWVLGLMIQHGTRPQAWPRGLRGLLG